MLLDIDEIPLEASNDLLTEQIRLRAAYLPRLTSRQLVTQMREEIAELQRRRDRRGD
jgi:hypothetical protein